MSFLPARLASTCYDRKGNFSVDRTSVPIHRESRAASIEVLWRCCTLARKGGLLRIHPDVDGTPASEGQLLGAEITFGETLIGHVEGLARDPISHRVWRLITSYGKSGRRVGVPMEWVVSRSPTRLGLAVGARSLDDLSEWTGP